MNELTHLVQKNQHKLFTKNLAWTIAWEYFIDKNITHLLFFLSIAYCYSLKLLHKICIDFSELTIF